MKLTLEEVSSDTDFLTLPDDSVLQVVVEGIELRDVPGTNGKEGWQKFSFKFKILDMSSNLESEYGVLIGTPIWGSVGARFTIHPDNKLRQWAEALLGFDISEPGFELDTDMLIGRKARAVTDTYPKKTGGRGQQIKGLLPLKADADIIHEQTSITDDPPF